MATTPKNGEFLYDLLGPFPQGMNSGVAPLLLPKQQLAFAINATVRGAYVKPRPAYQIRGLNFGGDAALQAAVEKGFFQGAGVYRPDFGPSQNVAQIGGRLFTFTEAGAAWQVAEITIPGDPNSATTNQVWMWQSEKWLIISDGTGALPIFYDGVSCRRSYGPSKLLATVTATSVPNPPAIGGAVVATLTAPYTGPVNIPVEFNGAFYEVAGTPSGSNNVSVTNIQATGGATVPDGTQVIANPNLIGVVQSVNSSSVTQFSALICVIPAFCQVVYRVQFVVTLSSVAGIIVGDGLSINTSAGLQIYTVDSISGNQVTMSRFPGATTAPCAVCALPPAPSIETIAANEIVHFAVSHGPSVILGVTVGAFVNPGVGSAINIQMTPPYLGGPGQLVQIGTGVYTITSLAPAAGLTITLINRTDTTQSTPYSFTLPIMSVPEIPACRMGAYGMMQNWFSLTDGIEFSCSDLVGASSGSQANNFRDAVLKTTNAEIMGNFRLPNAGFFINSMTFAATLDTSLGQGPLQIGTMVNMFSVKAPFDLSDFQGSVVSAPMSTPILTQSLIGFGPLGQNSTVAANSDTIFRQTNGLGSLKIGRREVTDDWGNAPISREMSRVVDPDNLSPLLSYSSAIVFDNRLRMTCAPKSSAQGVFHQGEIALNFDLVSSLRGKAPPVYDGLWTGLNVLQHVTGLFNTVQRSFAFTFNITLNKIELYELLDNVNAIKDNGDTPIQWVFETPVIFNADIKPIQDVVRLVDGEMYIADLQDTAHVKVLYRPVFYPCWITWTEFDVCADMSKTNAQPQQLYPLGFGEPSPTDCDPINNRPFREANAFQLRFEITGHFVWWGAKLMACKVPQPLFAKPACNL